MLLALKLIILAILFVISGGSLFSETFRKNLYLGLSAGAIASLTLSYMLYDVMREMHFIPENPVGPVISLSPSKETKIQPPPTEVVVKEPLRPKIPVLPASDKLPLNAEGQVDFAAVFSPVMSERDVLETNAEFAERQRYFEVHKQALINTLNEASLQQLSGVQAGIVSLVLDKAHYDVDTGVFKVSVQWLAWPQQFVSSLTNPVLEGVFQVGREDVKQLYAEGTEKALFITVTGDHQLQSSFLSGIGKTFPLNLELSSANQVSQEKLAAGQVFQDSLKDGGLGPKMVWIPKGPFDMGSDTGDSDEKPVHKVTIDYDYAMSQYEITFDDYDRFCEATGRAKPEDQGWGRGQRPVINVDWNDAKAYTQWLAEQTGKSYWLPSEAEWEYACRAGTTTAYSFGDDVNQLGTYAWYTENSGGKTHPVGEKEPNAFGLYDMHGNVWEWLEDVWHSNYEGAPLDGSAWMSGGTSDAHPLRGGSWDYNDDWLRCASRSWNNTTGGNSGWGLRLSRM